MVDSEIDEVDQVLKEIPEETDPIEITEENVQKAWLAYAKLFEDNDPRIYSTLMQHKPGLTADGKIEIRLISNAQRENFVNNIKPGLTKYFRENLANIEYVFEANLIENETTVKKIYTDADKLDYLIEKNKNLEDLKNRFKLDFDN